MDITKFYAKPEKTIKEHNDDLIKSLKRLWEYNYIPDKNIYDLTKIACIYHDYGKANYEFQKRVTAKKKIYFDETKEIAHNVLSLHFLKKEIFEDAEDYFIVGHAILNHHDYCDTLMILQDESKKKIIELLLDEFKDEIEPIGQRKIKKIKEVIDNKQIEKKVILIKGFLHKCDYSASAGMEVEYPNNFLSRKMEQLGYKWNDLQQFCKKNTDKNIIAVAQTGMGKTEGGLHWIGDCKGFFILPIRTAINAIYDRVIGNILNKEQIDERVALLHSGGQDYYNQYLSAEELNISDYYERGKKLSIPLTICTMDQLFDFVFKYNGYELKLATLSYSKVVIDEIQMYSPDLLAYLICGIKKINELGGKIAIVTATLPPFVKEEIKKALDFKVEEGVFVNNTIRHNIKVFDEQINVDIICNKYKENLKTNKSSKILVICNTIKKAQEIYSEIKKEFSKGEIELNLLHSRFIKEDRAKKEEEILKFGKTYIDESNDIAFGCGIWVSTSIVEASLDIDFDYLFTELSDLNSLFQRLGRCNRKGEKSIDKTNCYIFTKVYMGKHLDETIYKLSKNEIEKVNGIIDEYKKVDMINNCFTRDNIVKSKYFSEYSKFKDQIDSISSYEIEKKDINLRNIMSIDIIPSPIYIKYEQEILEYIEKIKEETDLLKRAKYCDKLRGFMISIPRYIFNKKERCIYYQDNSIKYLKIIVFECEYDEEVGFREIDYNNYKRETNLL